MTARNIVSAAALALLFVGAGCSYSGSANVNGAPKMCTMEAKQCPDGSYVGRGGPNCDFAPCPGTVPTASVNGSVDVMPKGY